MDEKLLTSLSREYLKSYYSINSFVGCTINCAYCFLAPIKIVPMLPQKTKDEETLVKETLADPFFVPGKTVLSLNNRTDPFINETVKNSTFELLKCLNRSGCSNIVTITTKGYLSPDDVLKLEEFENLRIIIIVTFNGLPLHIQPIDRSFQINTMKNVSDSKIVHLLQQFRPIIPGLNDSEYVIRETICIAKQYCEGTVYQGIRVNQKISDRLQNRGYQYKGTFDIHKQKTKQTDNLFERIQEEDLSYKIFDHTSCAISYLFNMPDYNLHYKKRDCNHDCPQYSMCHNSRMMLPDNAQEILRSVGIEAPFWLSGEKLFIDGPVSDEQKSYIKHIFHVQIESKGRKWTFSESIMEG